MTLPSIVRRLFAAVSVSFFVLALAACASGGSGTSTTTTTGTGTTGTTGTSGTGTGGTTTGLLAITTTALNVGIYNTAYTDTVKVSGGTAPYTFALTTGSLPTGISLNASTGAITGTPTQYGQGTLTILVTDSAGTTANAPVSLTIAYPLYFTGTSGSLILEQGANLTPSILQPSNGSNSPYTATIANGSLPPGLSITTQGVISGTPTTANTAANPVRFTITDRTGAQTTTFTVNFSVYPALTVTGGALPEGAVGSYYGSNVSLGISGGYPNYSASLASGTLPPGLSLSTGQISGTPTTAGDYAFTLSVRDSIGVTVTASYVIHIAAVLQVVVPTLPSAYAGQPYGPVTITATGGTAPYTYTLSVSYNATSGLVLSAAGVLSGTTNCKDFTSYNSTYALVLNVKDAAGRTSQATGYVTCKPTITLTPTNLPEAAVGSQYYGAVSFVAEGTVASTEVLSYTISSGSLPPGLTMSGRGVFSGVPTTVSTASFSVTAVSASGAKGTKSFSVRVSDSLPPGGYESVLNGAYAFNFSGYLNNPGNLTGTPFAKAMVGRLVFDGIGGLTGTYDSNSAADGFSAGNAVTGSYRLVLSETSTITDPYQTLGTMILKSGGTVSTFAFRIGAMNAGKTAADVIRFIQFDNVDSSSPAGVFGGGLAKRQTTNLAQADFSGNYVASLTGESASVSAGTPTGHFGGIVSIATIPTNGTSAIQNGAVQDVAYYSDAQLNITESATFNLTNPGVGRGTLTLNPTPSFSRLPGQYVFYAASASEIYLLSSDSHAAAFDLLAGTAQKQAITSFTPATALAGTAAAYSVGVTGGTVMTAGVTTAPSDIAATLQQYTFNSGTTFTRITKSTSASESGTVISTTPQGRYILRTNGDPTDVLLQLVDNNTAVGFALRNASSVPLGILNLQPAISSSNFQDSGYSGMPIAPPARSSFYVQSAANGSGKPEVSYTLANQPSGLTLTTGVLFYPPSFFSPYYLSGDRAVTSLGSGPLNAPGLVSAPLSLAIYEH